MPDGERHVGSAYHSVEQRVGLVLTWDQSCKEVLVCFRELSLKLSFRLYTLARFGL